MTALEFIVCALATWQILAIWTTGEIFATVRAHLEVYSDTYTVAYWLLCPFCLSPYVAILTVVTFIWCRDGWLFVFQLLVWAFAVSRVAVCANEAHRRIFIEQ